jgi:hypothetical protein
MAESILSPGVFARENDLSFTTEVAVEAGAAIIGPTVKGPKEIPTLVTSYSDYKNRFGDKIKSGSQYYSYFTSLAVENYFNNGGTSVLVTRVVSGSYSSAVSTAVSNSLDQTAFVLETLSEGEDQNSISTEVSGTLPSGSMDNLRWEIVGADTGSGTFNLLIRRGDDSSLRGKIILETWANLSLDPNQNNYISKVIGDYKFGKIIDGNDVAIGLVTGSYPNVSRYVRVKSVNTPTLDYFDNAGDPKPEYTASIPINSSGSFENASGVLSTSTTFYQNGTSGTEVQGIPAGGYTDAIKILRNKDQYNFNIITVPGLVKANSAFSSVITDVVNLAQDRGDCFFPVDLTNWANPTVSSAVIQAQTFDTNYAAAYWPWVQIPDNAIGQNVWVPASVVIPGVYAFNDQQAAPWFAPAGINRGGLGSVIRTQINLNKNQRDTLYNGKINPLATFPGQGVTVFGQKTLQKKASALDRVNVRRLLIELKGFIGSQSRRLVFEQNTTRTRNQFLSIVNPYLESVQQRQGLFAFKVVMDDSNNTPDVIDRNELVGQIYLQPTRTAEYIILDFNIEPTGTTFG